jgi:hypothetical protein
MECAVHATVRALISQTYHFRTSPDAARSGVGAGDEVPQSKDATHCVPVSNR